MSFHQQPSSNFRAICLGSVLAVSAFCAPPIAHATVLTFERVSSDFNNSAALPATYGDRVAATEQDDFRYGTAFGFTPNIVADYLGGPLTWTTDYGDLLNVIYQTSGQPFLELSLAADPGYLVELQSFDLGGWADTTYTINSVSVLDGLDNVLFTQANATVLGDGGNQHSSFVFTTPLTAPTLRIRFDATNLASTGTDDNIGLDNVAFSQIAVIPEPSTYALLVGLACLAARALRRQKR
jgi:hypothetical protein